MKELYQAFLGLCIVAVALAMTGVVFAFIAYCAAKGFSYGWG